MTDPAPPDFRALSSYVTGAWPQIVDAWEEFRVKHGLRLRVDLGDSDPPGFLAEALGAAYLNRCFKALVALFEERGLLDPGFAPLAAPYLGTGFVLQAHVSGVWRVQYAADGEARLRRARETVCRISIDGAHKGTGVLIKPNLVATAAHVVEMLVDDHGQAIDGSLARLTLHFSPGSDEDEDEDAPAPIVARLADRWLAHHSGPAPNEGKSLAITSIDGIAAHGPWDLAVIRLYAPPAEGLNGYARLGSAAAAPSFGLHVLHHPADALGAPMGLLWSIGEVRQALGAPLPLRWLHNANTDGGSSGGPCFDNEWKLVALHQAGPHKITEADQINRAVPIFGWVTDIDRWTVEAAATPFLDFVDDEAGKRTPVIGRRDLQAAVWRSMNGSEPASRAFIVRGGEGMGKNFTLSIVRGLAGLAGHSVASLDMRNAHGDDAATLAERIVGALAAEFSGPALLPTKLTSALRDVRNEIAPTLLAELNKLAAARQAWLLLYGFDDSALALPTATLQLVELMLAGLDAAPNLRLVLVGWTGPQGSHHLETLDEPTANDIVSHILVALAPGGAEAPVPVRLMVEGMVSLMLQNEPPGAPYARAAAVAERVRAMVVDLVPAAGGGQ